MAKQQPQKLASLIKGFDTAAKANKVYPIGGGLWSMVLHPEAGPVNPATEFQYTQDVTAVPEAVAPKLGGRSNLITITTEIKPDSAGVLYAIGAFSGGLTLWVEDGKLNYEFNLFEIERTRITSSQLPQGKVKIEIESRYSGTGNVKSGDIVIRANGTEVAKGRVPRNAPVGFTANDAFDVGMDSYSPVSLAYYDRAPFKFNGKIDKFEVRYLQ